MAKRVVGRPAWLKGTRVVNVYSVSGCVARNFADYAADWMHNGFWFFDAPEIILELARQKSLDLTGTRLFFYEAHELEFDDTERRWRAFGPEPSLRTQVVPPAERTLAGYDVVTFSTGNSAECSPLSCNLLAAELETNQHCLLESFERAKDLLETGRFTRSEPGPYRVLAVYSTEWPRHAATAPGARARG